MWVLKNTSALCFSNAMLVSLDPVLRDICNRFRKQRIHSLRTLSTSLEIIFNLKII